MGLTTTAPLVLPTRRTVAFTSSTTWTVPSSCIYADVMVVGGGSGGQGGNNNNSGTTATPGSGGGITILTNLYLNGTGTVSIVVGAGGTGGAAGTPGGVVGTAGGYSGFGTYVYSQGANANSSVSGYPGYKGTVNNAYSRNDLTLSNFAPTMGQPPYTTAGSVFYPQSTNTVALSAITSGSFFQTMDGNGIGWVGGIAIAGGTGAPAGGYYGSNNIVSTQNYPASPTLPWGASSLFTFGTPTAGGTATGTGGAAGSTGYAGSGGGNNGSSPYNGTFAGQGAGGGGANSTGSSAGNGGNAGTNTGAGGGAGGSSASGTAGTGGNGGSGFVIVSYIGTN